MVDGGTRIPGPSARPGACRPQRISHRAAQSGGPAGFCFGQVIQFDPAKRRQWMVSLGLGMTLAFLAQSAESIYTETPFAGPEPCFHSSGVPSTPRRLISC